MGVSATVGLIIASFVTVPLSAENADMGDLNRCGSLSLEFCALAVGRETTEAELAPLLPTQGQETSLAELQQAAGALGLQTLAVRWNGAPPPCDDAPAIIPVARQEGDRHFIVMLRSRGEHVLLVDVPQPAFWATERWLREKLKWQGDALHIAQGAGELDRLRAQISPWRRGLPFLPSILLVAVLAEGLVRRSIFRRLPGERRRNRARPQAGFTIVEMLVSLSVIALLLSIILPALQSARESSRRTQCLNNLRQLGQACSARESATGKFPSALNGQKDASGFGGRLSPHVALLPYLDQGPLYDRIDQTEDGAGAGDDPPTSTKNPEALETTVPVFVCPSDRVPTGGNSYRVSIGTSPQMHETVPKNEDAALVGALAGQSGVRPQKIRDGLSYTVFFSEKRVGDRKVDYYTPWRDYFLSGGTMTYPADALRNCQLPVGVSPEHVSFGGSTWLLAGYDSTWYNHIAPPNASLPDCSDGRSSQGAVGGSFAARSEHPGGVNVVFGDGAARFVSETIDLKVWRALGTRDGGEAVSADF